MDTFDAVDTVVVDARIERILDAAGRAPSVHNTQPWNVDVKGNRLLIRADASRQLHQADPQGREMYISCGAFVFNAATAARRESLTARTVVLPDPADERLVAELELSAGARPTMDELGLSVAIQRRTTSRVPFDDRPVAPDVLRAIRAAASTEGGELRFVHPSDPARSEVLELVRRAERQAGADAEMRAEEAAWTATDDTRRDGIPHELLGPAPNDDRAPVRRFRHSSGHAQFEQRSTMAVLATPGDTVRDWIGAGIALEHLLLVATGYFVHASFATTALENPVTRDGLRAALSLEAAPQMLMRFGYCPRPRRAPRRPTTDLT